MPEHVAVITALLLGLFRQCIGNYPSLVGNIDPIEIGNDHVLFTWKVPSTLASRLATYRLTANSIKEKRPLISVTLPSQEMSYNFLNLVGNTTYRISIEGFDNTKKSIWYISRLIDTTLAELDWLPAPTDITLLAKSDHDMELSWTTPIVAHASKQAMVNQHLVQVSEFNVSSKSTVQRLTLNVRLPQTRVLIPDLSPNSVYNITIRAGTDNGYGFKAWAVYSTLSGPQAIHVLKLKMRTPNSLTLKWPINWLATTNAAYTIRAVTLHSTDGSEKEVTISSFQEEGVSPEFTLRDLSSGATFNVTLSSAGKGEFLVSEPRIAAETDHAASLVWKRVHHHEPVEYQIRFAPNDGGKPFMDDPKSEGELLCPKYGCDWMCALVFNLDRHPRDYAFDIRAKVDGIWNKWMPVARRNRFDVFVRDATIYRPWTLLERVCSINPPPFFVENVHREEYMREIDIDSSDMTKDAWRYLVVVDRRHGHRENVPTALDVGLLTDKAAAEHDRVPYYIAASLTVDQVEQHIPFRIGDGVVHGGYLNYPLDTRDADPRWMLVPIGQHENEMMEPRTKMCGITEHGLLDCDIPLLHLTAVVPWWMFVAIALLLFCVLVFICCCCCCCCRKIKKARSRKVSKKSWASGEVVRQMLDDADQEFL